MASITRSQILRQLKKDLIGKDSYRGVTLTYSWLANQFGHIALGFIPTVILFKYFLRWGVSDPSFWAAVTIAGTWLLFELYNFLGPLLMNKSKAGYTFSPAWRNVAFDTATDVCFFAIGAFFASLVCHETQTAKYVIITLLLIVAYPVYYWFTTKMYLQEAGYPFQFRLSQWAKPIEAGNKDIIQKFQEHAGPGKHLLLFGAKGSGKTSLSVGLATECSIRHSSCMYVTVMKLFSMFFEPDKTDADSQSLWAWRNSSVLVIDDINPGNPVNDVVFPEIFYQCLTNPDCQDVNMKAIKEKAVIWVLGSEGADGAFRQKWEQMLLDMGVGKDEILVVNLDRE